MTSSFSVVKKFLLSPYSTEKRDQTGMTTTHEKEMNMAKVRILRLGPNAAYIPLLGFWFGGNANFNIRVGGNANSIICVGGNANFSVFRYQHVGIPNARTRHKCFCFEVEYRLYFLPLI